MKPALLHSETQSVVSFSVIPKYRTLKDPEWLFCFKFGFCAGLAGSDRATCVKTNKDQILSWRYLTEDGSTASMWPRRHVG